MVQLYFAGIVTAEAIKNKFSNKAIQYCKFSYKFRLYSVVAKKQTE